MCIESEKEKQTLHIGEEMIVWFGSVSYYMSLYNLLQLLYNYSVTIV